MKWFNKIFKDNDPRPQPPRPDAKTTKRDRYRADELVYERVERALVTEGLDSVTLYAERSTYSTPPPLLIQNIAEVLLMRHGVWTDFKVTELGYDEAHAHWQEVVLTRAEKPAMVDAETLRRSTLEALERREHDIERAAENLVLKIVTEAAPTAATGQGIAKVSVNAGFLERSLYEATMERARQKLEGAGFKVLSLTVSTGSRFSDFAIELHAKIQWHPRDEDAPNS